MLWIGICFFFFSPNNHTVLEKCAVYTNSSKYHLNAINIAGHFSRRRKKTKKLTKNRSKCNNIKSNIFSRFVWKKKWSIYIVLFIFFQLNWLSQTNKKNGSDVVVAFHFYCCCTNELTTTIFILNSFIIIIMIVIVVLFSLSFQQKYSKINCLIKFHSHAPFLCI